MIKNTLMQTKHSRAYIFVSLYLLSSLFCVSHASAQNNEQNSVRAINQNKVKVPKTRKRNVDRVNANKGLVTLIAGAPNTLLTKIAHDISVVVNDGDDLRVVPIIGDGTPKNIRDILFMRGVDIGIIDVEILEHYKNNKRFRNLKNRLAYITLLFPNKLQIIAKKQIKDIQDLQGKKVSVGLQGSTEDFHSNNIFNMLELKVKKLFENYDDSIELLKRNEIDAVVCFCSSQLSGSQSAKYKSLVDKHHFIAIPHKKKILTKYLPAQLSHKDFPNFIQEGQNLPTIAIRLLLVTFNWPSQDQRHDRVAKFVNSLFSKIPELHKRPRHKLWNSVNITADLPNWYRFEAANNWLSSRRNNFNKNLESTFNDFLNLYQNDKSSKRDEIQSELKRKKLFEDFVKWQREVRQ